MVAAVAIFVGAAATVIQAVISFIKRSHVRATIRIDDVLRGDIAGAMINLEHGSRYLPLRGDAVAEAGIEVVVRTLAENLRRVDRDEDES